MARRPGQLTEEDKLILQSQGLPPDCQSELDIMKARYELDKRRKLVDVKLRQLLSRDEAIKNIAYVLNTTQNDGGKDVTGYMYHYLSVIMHSI